MKGCGPGAFLSTDLLHARGPARSQAVQQRTPGWIGGGRHPPAPGGTLATIGTRPTAISAVCRQEAVNRRRRAAGLTEPTEWPLPGRVIAERTTRAELPRKHHGGHRRESAGGWRSVHRRLGRDRPRQAMEDRFIRRARQCVRRLRVRRAYGGPWSPDVLPGIRTPTSCTASSCSLASHAGVRCDR